MSGGLFFLRLAVSVIFIYHSVPKLKDPKKMATGMGWTVGQVVGLGMVEFISAIAILGGMGAHLGSLLLMAIMAGAIYHKIKKWHMPFMGTSGTGWEFDFLLLCANLTIYLKY